MDENARIIESLLERATEYGKTSLELVKLKALYKSSDVASTILPHSTVILLVFSFMFFLNLGLAYWFGGMLGKIEYGFFIIAAFYGLIGILVHFFMQNWIKKVLWNFIIRKVMKSQV
ncbi:MAG: hypothetical protein HXX13_04160 [Bacteroidetes bacterium]|nr:hypothetical protein [Bacteroidota bacterium]